MGPSTGLVTFLVMVLGQTAAAAKNQTADCYSAAEAVGVNISSFANSVAHGIHSITVEDVRFFLQPNFPLDNSLPTANTNLTDTENPVLPSAPSFPSMFEFPSGRLLDYILTNNDDVNTFYVHGLSSLEKFTHGVHMHEVWVRAREQVDQLRRDRMIRKGALCPCLLEETADDILTELAVAYHHLQTFSDLNSRRRGEYVYIGSNSFVYPSSSLIQRSEGRRLPNSDPLPPLSNSTSWEPWKQMLALSMLSDQEIFNLAVYLYCKLY